MHKAALNFVVWVNYSTDFDPLTIFMRQVSASHKCMERDSLTRRNK